MKNKIEYSERECNLCGSKLILYRKIYTRYKGLVEVCTNDDCAAIYEIGKEKKE